MLVEVVEQVVEMLAVFYHATLLVQDHQATVIAERHRILGNALLWELEFELGELHIGNLMD